MQSPMKIEDSLQKTRQKTRIKRVVLVTLFISLIASIALLRLAVVENTKIAETENTAELKQHFQYALIYAGSAFFFSLIAPCYLIQLLPSKEEVVYFQHINSSKK